MDALVTYDRLRAVWPDAPQDVELVETVIEQASAFILAKLREARIEVNPSDELQRINMETVCCNLVRRVAPSECTAGYGATSLTQAVGAIQMTQSYGSPLGSFYLEKGEREVLGLRRSFIGFAGSGAV